MKCYFRVCLTVVIVGYSILSLPSFSSAQQSIQLKGLHDRVTITRDERGIPYIEAKNDEDLYFAQGYVTASDRLWQMDLFRRTARGELDGRTGYGVWKRRAGTDLVRHTARAADRASRERACATYPLRCRARAWLDGCGGRHA